MKLDDVRAEVRPRGHWEAIDLGFRLVRPHLPLMLASSSIVVLPLFILVHAGFWGSLGWATMILWWLKPLWERVNLFILSRSLFGDTPTLRETLHEFRSYGFKQWFLWLTIRRLSPTRSLDLPVTQLEGLGGDERARRLTVLRRGNTGNGALWLLMICANMEGFIFLGVIILIELLVPETMDFSPALWMVDWERDGTNFSLLAQNLCVQLAAILVAPFYIGAGFALYINRRTTLEGWDIEIQFRQIAERLKAQSETRAQRGNRVGLVATLLISVFLFQPNVGRAENDTLYERDTEQTELSESPEATAAREAIVEILASDPFHNLDTFRVPKLVLDWSFDFDDEEEPAELPKWLEAFLEFFARALALISEVTLIAGAVLLISYIVYRYRDELAELTGLGSARKSSTYKPTKLFGLDVTRESLPDDVPATVLQLWRAGDLRAAIALLYRASLAELMLVHAVEFEPSFTEGDCLRATRTRVDTDCANYFAGLTRHWQLIAYAHRPPHDQTVEELCSSWLRFFRVAPPAEGDDGP